MEKHAFIKACLKLVDTEGLSMMMAATRAAKLVENGQLVSFGKYVYRTKTAHAESRLANRVKQFLRAETGSIPNLDSELRQEEDRLGVQFAPEQREAIKMALSHSLSLITGGPGTGKTMIQKAILDIYSRNDPEEKVCCCAPTGRAARRMEDSTGLEVFSYVDSHRPRQLCHQNTPVLLCLRPGRAHGEAPHVRRNPGVWRQILDAHHPPPALHAGQDPG